MSFTKIVSVLYKTDFEENIFKLKAIVVLILSPYSSCRPFSLTATEDREGMEVDIATHLCRV